MTFKPHFRKVDGQWRLYRDRKESRLPNPVWYDLVCHRQIDAMWDEFQERLAVVRYYRRPQ